MVSRHVVFITVVAVIALAVCAVQGVTDVEKHKQDVKHAVEQDYDAWLAYWEAKQDAKDAAELKGRRTSEVNSSNAFYSGFATSMKKSSMKLSKKCSKIIKVEKNGKGNFKSIQDAVDSVKLNNKERVCIKIAAGIYYEKILVPVTKDFITFQGAGQKYTILSWGDTAAKANGTSRSASTAVEANNFIAKDLTFRNSAPAPLGGAVGKQAVAFRIKGDMAAFYRVAFYGAQDTLYDQNGRHYFEKCFIQGSIDFIFGDGQSLYKNCHLNSIANPYSGSLTAQKRSAKNSTTGYSFVNCHVTGSGPIYLGRAWGPFSRVVFIRTYLEDIILPQGWFDWGEISRRKTVFYGQYKCSGPGAVTKGRVKWSKELTAKQARPFSTISFIDGKDWL